MFYLSELQAGLTGGVKAGRPQDAIRATRTGPQAVSKMFPIA